jgi:hypothetical protein
MTSAWVLPALVGPLIAGTITDVVGWRWVFLGVPVIAVASLVLMREALRAIAGDSDVTIDTRRVVWAALVAAGVLGVSVAGQRTVAWWPVLIVIAVSVTVTFASRLLPPGTWHARRGLPSVVVTRSLLAAGFFAAETYVPLSLVQLTAAAVLWFAGSWLAAHATVLESKPLRVRLGAMCVLVGTGAGFLTLMTSVPVVVVAAVWSLGGLGMGMAASTLGVLVLDHSTTAEQGANSAAMQTSDAVTQSLVLALGSVAFAVALTEHEQMGYLLVFGTAVAVAALGVLTSWRVSSTAS